MTTDDLQRIPGVGPKLAAKLRLLGHDDVASLKKADPERMYQRLMELLGEHVDRCVLYVFRLAVYYATIDESGIQPEPDRLLWWNWKDKG